MSQVRRTWQCSFRASLKIMKMPRSPRTSKTAKFRRDSSQTNGAGGAPLYKAPKVRDFATLVWNRVWFSRKLRAGVYEHIYRFNSREMK